MADDRSQSVILLTGRKFAAQIIWMFFIQISDHFFFIDQIVKNASSAVCLIMYDPLGVLHLRIQKIHACDHFTVQGIPGILIVDLLLDQLSGGLRIRCVHKITRSCLSIIGQNISVCHKAEIIICFSHADPGVLAGKIERQILIHI